MSINVRRWLGKSRHDEAARVVYGRVVAAARRPAFYVDCGVPDTPDGRFDMVALHAFLVLRRLKRVPGPASDLGQAVFDLMFADMDQNLREMGVGDLGVGRMVKAMATAFYGRVDAYEKGLADGPAALDEAIRRNVFRHGSAAADQVRAVSDYVTAADRALADTELQSVVTGLFEFVEAPTVVSGRRSVGDVA